MKRNLSKIVLAAALVLGGVTSAWADVIETVGNTNNSSTWWTAFSTGDYKVAKGEGRHITFVNHNTGSGSNWLNWLVGIYSASNGGGTEYGIVRSDNYGWGNYSVGCWSTIDFTSFASEMNGATVDMYIYYKDSYVFVYNTITTSNSSSWTYNFSFYNVSGDYVYPRFTVELSYIEITASETVSLPEGLSDYAFIGRKDVQLWVESLHANTIPATAGSSIHYRFKNYYIGENAWENFKIRGYQMTYNETTEAYDITTEKFMMRADHYDDVTAGQTTHNFGSADLKSVYADGALIDAVVTYNNDNTATVRADITTADGTASYYEEETIAIDGTLPLYVKPAVNGAYLEMIKEASTYTVSVSSSNDSYGTVSITSGATGGVANAGANVTVTATPKDGYRFVNWVENGSEVSIDAEYTLRALDDHTLVANFVSEGAVGATDYTSNYRHDYYGSDITLTKGETKKVSFQNHGLSTQYYFNWVMDINYNSSLVTTIRADWHAFGIGTFTDGYTFSTDGGTTLSDGNVWDSFPTDMTDAKVELTLSYSSDGSLAVNGTMTKDNNIYYYKYSYGSDLTADITLRLSVDHAWLNDVEIEQLAVAATLGSNGYATFANSNALDLANLPSGLTAYKAKVNGSYVNFSEVTAAVPANTGLLLAGNASETYSVPVADSALELDDNDFWVNTDGTTFTADANTTYYGMIKDSNPLTFGTFDPSSVAIPADKAYLKVSATSARELIAMFDDMTGIKTIDNTASSDDNYFNLAGQRVAAPAKGLYIVNGKKYIVK